MGVRIALALCAAIAGADPAASDPIVGRAVAIDGDSLVVGGVEVRLCGIDAPEHGAPGGERASGQLRRLVHGKVVRCIRVGEGSACDGRSKPTSYDRVVATCSIDGLDLARAMVQAGAACDWRRFSGGRYRVEGGCER